MTVQARTKYNLFDTLYYYGEMGEKTPFKVNEILVSITFLGNEVLYLDKNGNAKRECELFKEKTDGFV